MEDLSPQSIHFIKEESLPQKRCSSVQDKVKQIFLLDKNTQFWDYFFLGSQKNHIEFNNWKGVIFLKHSWEEEKELKVNFSFSSKKVKVKDTLDSSSDTIENIIFSNIKVSEIIVDNEKSLKENELLQHEKRLEELESIIHQVLKNISNWLISL